MSDAFVNSLTKAFENAMMQKLGGLAEHLSKTLTVDKKKVEKALASFEWSSFDTVPKGSKTLAKTPSKTPAKTPSKKLEPTKKTVPTKKTETPVKKPASAKSVKKTKDEIPLKERIRGLESDKFFNVDTKHDVKKSRQAQAKYVFYDKFRICGKEGSELLAAALKELGGKKEDASTTKPKATNKPKTPAKKAPEVKTPSGMPKTIKRNKHGNYCDAESGFVFSREKQCVIGKEADDGEVLPLEDEDIIDLDARGWQYEKLDEEKVNESVIDELDDDE